MKNAIITLPAVIAVLFVVSCANPATPPATETPGSPGGPAPTVASVTITGNPSVEKGNTYTFTATVTGENSPSQAVTWSLKALDGSDAEITADTGTKITSAGVLSIAAGEAAAKLKIKAVSVADTTKFGEITVTVVEAGTKTIDIGDPSGSPTFGTAGTASYTITIANIDDGESVTVKWYDSETGGTGVETLPTGITANAPTVASNSATLELSTTATTPAGIYWFTVTIDSTESARKSLTVQKKTIAAVEISDLDAPVAPNPLDAEFTAIPNTTYVLTWYEIPGEETPAPGNAGYQKVYRAHIVLTAAVNYGFTGLEVSGITASGIDADYDTNGFADGKKLTLNEAATEATIDLVFPRTDPVLGSTQLGKPDKPALSNEGVATWSALSSETGVAKYSVQLYKDGSPQGVPVEVTQGSIYSHDFLTAMRNGDPGSYTVTVTAIGNGTTYSNSEESVKSDPQTVTRQTGDVQYLWWVDNSALVRWVTTAGPANYSVQLYKGDTPVGSPVTVPRDDSTPDPGNENQKVTTHDFAAAITTEGAGSYKFAVTAKGDDKLVLDSDPVEAASKTFAVPSISTAVLTLTGADTADLTLTFSEAVTVSGSAGLTLSGTSVTISGVSSTGSNTTHTFTLSALAGTSETVTLGYSGNTIKNANGISPAVSTSVAVTKKLAKPVVILSNQGVASWTDLSVGGTSASYSAQLFKGGTAEGTAVTAPSATHNFLDAMRDAGLGTYTVKVSAALEGYGTSESEVSNEQEVRWRTGVQYVWWEGIEARWIDPDASGAYEVQLYKSNGSSFEKAGSAISVPRQGTYHNTTGEGIVETRTIYDFGSAFITHGPGDYNFKVTAKGDTYLVLDGEESSASSSKTVTKFDIITEQWKTTESVTLGEDLVLESGSFVIPVGKTLVIESGHTLTAGLLELASGTWKASGQNVGIGENYISLWQGKDAKFGKDDGAAATVLVGPFQDNKDTSLTTYTASVAKVTIAQDGNNLSITGATGAILTFGKSAGIYVKSGLTVSGVELRMYVENDYECVLYLVSGGVITLEGNSKIDLNPGDDTVESGWWGNNTLNVGTGISVKRISNGDRRLASFTGFSSDNTITSKGAEYWITKNNTHNDH